jgi:hypothetical protein
MGNSIENKIEVSILWLFGMLGIAYSKKFNQEDELLINIFNVSKPVIIRNNKKVKHKKEKKHKNPKKNDKKWNSYINKAVIVKLIDTLGKIWRELKPDNIFADIKVGFNDPMYTGFLYALYSEFSHLLIKENIQIQPVFDEQSIKGKFLAGGNIWIFNFLVIALGFIFSSPIRKIMILKMKERGGAQYVR